jgi:hypothetical protein
MAVEPVHQLADQKPPITRTKCGLEIDRRYDKATRVSVWADDITCTDCEPPEEATWRP